MTEGKLEFEELETALYQYTKEPLPPVYRTPVPGGWIIVTGLGGGFFYPDPDHMWDGCSSFSLFRHEMGDER